MLIKNPEELLQKIKQLEQELKQVKSCKRYGLVWEDKPEIFEEKAKNALPILKEDKNLRIEETEEKPNNIIIEGDNFHSLSALSYTHKGKIDVIYIDPPYNTGNKDFIYNDRFVDKEDSYRHSKWLSFMNKRLKLARDLLSDDGVILISIDNNEFAQLKILCDEIFNENNNLGIIKWRRTENQSNIAKYISTITEYIFCYGKNKDFVQFNKMPLSEKALKEYRYYDEKGKFRRNILLDKKKGKHKYDIITPNGNILNGPWMKDEVEFYKLLNDNMIYWSERGDFTPYLKNYLDNSNGVIVNDFWDTDKGSNQQSSLELERILGNNKAFNFPKHTKLIKNLLKFSSQKNSTILDFFAGSGTTGHAVMELNKEDSGNRQFILCSSRENTKEEPEKNICRDITYKRNKKVILGYKNAKGEEIEGLGGNLRYYKTEFIKTDKSIDDLRYSFIDMCDDLLCIKENTFNEVKLKKSVPELRLFKKGKNYTAILYDIHYFEDLKKLLEVLDGQIAVYIFSLSKDIFEEELEYFKNVKVQNIPDDILTTYNKIFNF